MNHTAVSMFLGKHRMGNKLSHPLPSPMQSFRAALTGQGPALRPPPRQPKMRGLKVLGPSNAPASATHHCFVSEDSHADGTKSLAVAVAQKWPGMAMAVGGKGDCTTLERQGIWH